MVSIATNPPKITKNLKDTSKVVFHKVRNCLASAHNLQTVDCSDNYLIKKLFNVRLNFTLHEIQWSFEIQGSRLVLPL